MAKSALKKSGGSAGGKADKPDFSKAVAGMDEKLKKAKKAEGFSRTAPDIDDGEHLARADSANASLYQAKDDKSVWIPYLVIKWVVIDGPFEDTVVEQFIQIDPRHDPDEDGNDFSRFKRVMALLGIPNAKVAQLEKIAVALGKEKPEQWITTKTKTGKDKKKKVNVYLNDPKDEDDDDE